MADDTPKWDCELISEEDGIAHIRNNNYKDIDNPMRYIGKIIRLSEQADMQTSSAYWQKHNVENYWFDTWGFVGQFMFELIPNSEYTQEHYDIVFHLGKLIAILDKKK